MARDDHYQLKGFEDLMKWKINSSGSKHASTVALRCCTRAQLVTTKLSMPASLAVSTLGRDDVRSWLRTANGLNLPAVSLQEGAKWESLYVVQFVVYYAANV